MQTRLKVLLYSQGEAQPLLVVGQNMRDPDGVPMFGFSGVESS